MHFLDQAVAVVIKVCQRGIDLLGPQVGVLAEDLLGGPSVVVMLSCEMDDLVTRPVDPGGATRVEAQVGVLDERAHARDHGSNSATLPPSGRTAQRRRQCCFRLPTKGSGVKK